MISVSRRSTSSVRGSVLSLIRQMATTSPAPPPTRKPREEGTIASVFASLSGEKPTPLPERFQELKKTIISTQSQQNEITKAWRDLCNTLKKENEAIVATGEANIPEITFTDLKNGLSASSIKEVQKRGVVIVRGVVPEQQAEKWLEEIRQYIKANPSVKGFPEDDKQVFELYWSKPQIEAREYPSSLLTQRTLLNLFNKDKESQGTIDLATPLTYCDRLRIRNPGDSKFALGPHVDGGSIERWEDPIYRSSYTEILDGDWKNYNAWRVGGRPEANMNMYDGPGSCGVFRILQGWTSLSTTGPGEGHLRVYPLIKESSAYMILRPFFKSIKPRVALPNDAFLHPDNWELDLDSSDFPNSPLGRSQEFNDETHPHLELSRTMTTLKRVNPGDQAWWHCDGIHSVEATHAGTGPSSVLYIPVVPLTLSNIHYIKDQRDAFAASVPPPDFPGGVGEQFFVGKGTTGDVRTGEGRSAMGLEKLDLGAGGDEELVRASNAVLGF